MLQAPVAYGLQYTIKSKWKKLFILVLLFQPREQKVEHLVLCFSSQVLIFPVATVQLDSMLDLVIRYQIQLAYSIFTSI